MENREVLAKPCLSREVIPFSERRVVSDSANSDNQCGYKVGGLPFLACLLIGNLLICYAAARSHLNAIGMHFVIAAGSGNRISFRVSVGYCSSPFRELRQFSSPISESPPQYAFALRPQSSDFEDLKEAR